MQLKWTEKNDRGASRPGKQSHMPTHWSYNTGSDRHTCRGWTPCAVPMEQGSGDG